ncbi:hypothetical protein C5B94_08505 [Clavibacter michiganensis]|uniref:hypothetical protein n=1 Tax=Clavibacter michiganensis TaxID=28447 RepID=UPI000CE7ADE0|nr:hypothetical protein [Clavibacter michiganensis]PPF54061.1 hypothetical protein C5B94_08505 [Clavibacter michiganensis]
MHDAPHAPHAPTPSNRRRAAAPLAPPRRRRSRGTALAGIGVTLALLGGMAAAGPARAADGHPPAASAAVAASRTRGTSAVDAAAGHLRQPSVDPAGLHGPDAPRVASADPIAQPDGLGHLWNRVKRAFTHWTTIHLAAWELRTFFSVGGAVAVGFICATPGVGAALCGIAGAIVTFLVGVTNGAPGCIQRGYYLSVPDFKSSHCA